MKVSAAKVAVEEVVAVEAMATELTATEVAAMEAAATEAAATEAAATEAAATKAAATKATAMKAAATEPTAMTASQQQRWCFALALEQTQQQGKIESNNQPAAKVTTLASPSGVGVIVGTAPSNDQYCDSEQH